MPKANQLNNKTFQDEAKAREWLEAQLWPSGPVCGHCGTLNESTALSTRPGWYREATVRSIRTSLKMTRRERRRVRPTTLRAGWSR